MNTPPTMPAESISRFLRHSPYTIRLSTPRAILTKHAERRLSERSNLSPQALATIINQGASIPIGLSKGGLYANRLLYSIPDDAWFIAVQSTNNGYILTVMPLHYNANRTTVTAAQRRSARCRVRAMHAAQRERPSPQPNLQLKTTKCPTP